MRFVPIEQVEEGMIIAQTIFGVNGEIMVKAGMPIKAVKFNIGSIKWIDDFDNGIILSKACIGNWIFGCRLFYEHESQIPVR